MTPLKRPSIRWVIVAFVGAAVVAALLILVGIVLADNKRSQLGLEFAKAGMQLGVVTLLGLVLTQVLKRADVEREERHRLNEYRLTVFRDAIEAYNSVKAVRRALRAAGLSMSANRHPQTRRGSRRRRRSQHQTNEFDALMRELNDAELSLERIGREVTAQKEVFPNASKVIDKLEDVKTYLRGVLNVWEKRALLTTTPDKRQEESLEKLRGFLARRGQHFIDDFWTSFDEFERAIRADFHD